MVCIFTCKSTNRQTTNPHYRAHVMICIFTNKSTNHPSSSSTEHNISDGPSFYQQEYEPSIHLIDSTQHKRWSTFLPARAQTIHPPRPHYTTQVMGYNRVNHNTSHSSTLYSKNDGLLCYQPQHEPLIHHTPSLFTQQVMIYNIQCL